LPGGFPKITEPSVSTAIIFMAGNFSFNFLETPAMVPQELTPINA